MKVNNDEWKWKIMSENEKMMSENEKNEWKWKKGWKWKIMNENEKKMNENEKKKIFAKLMQHILVRN